MNKNPLISVITVVYNGVATLERTINSVINQTYQNVEFIIIDGGSKDGTIDIIKKYEKHISCWVSEPDNGIYDAMNKGINLSKGDWIYFLGSDDQLFNTDVLFQVSKILKKEFAMVAGCIKYEKGSLVKSKFNANILLHNTVHHQSAFYNKLLLFNGQLRYNTSYKILADYELNLMIYLNKDKTLFIDNIIALCSDLGISRSSFYKVYLETNLIRKKVLCFPFNLIFTILFTVKYLAWLIIKR